MEGCSRWYESRSVDSLHVKVRATPLRLELGPYAFSGLYSFRILFLSGRPMFWSSVSTGKAGLKGITGDNLFEWS